MKLSPPWTKFYKELEALFKDDPGIKMSFAELEDVENACGVLKEQPRYKIELYVEGANKAEALSELLPTEKQFGNVTVYIDVIPANLNKEDIVQLYRAAFEGNPAFSYAEAVTGISAPNFNYIVFEPEVVQFFNDDLGDINGYCSTLYQEIAKDVFVERPGVYFCTDLNDDVANIEVSVTN